MMCGSILLLGLIIWLILRQPAGAPPAPYVRGEDAALQTLRERYARGEISREEFEERRRTLEDGA